MARSTKETVLICAALLVGASMCGNTAQHMSAGSTAKVATVSAATGAGAAAGYGCSRVGVRTCLGGGGGGGKDGGKKASAADETPATTPESPPATQPPAPEPEATPAPAPGVPVNGGTTPGGIIIPGGTDLGRSLAHAYGPGTNGPQLGQVIQPCGVGGIGMSEC